MKLADRVRLIEGASGALALFRANSESKTLFPTGRIGLWLRVEYLRGDDDPFVSPFGYFRKNDVWHYNEFCEDLSVDAKNIGGLFFAEGDDRHSGAGLGGLRYLMTAGGEIDNRFLGAFLCRLALDLQEIDQDHLQKLLAEHEVNRYAAPLGLL